MSDAALTARVQPRSLVLSNQERGLASIGGLDLQRLYYTLEILCNLLHVAFVQNSPGEEVFEEKPRYEFAKGVSPEVLDLHSSLWRIQYDIFEIRHHLLLLADSTLPDGDESVSVAARLRNGAITELETQDDSLLRPENLRKVERVMLSAPALLEKVSTLLKSDPVLRGLVNIHLDKLRKGSSEVPNPDDEKFKDWMSFRGVEDLPKRRQFHPNRYEIASSLMLHTQSADHAAKIAGDLKGVFEWMIQACGIKEETWLEKALDSKPFKALGITSLLKSLLAQEPTTARASLLR